MGELITVAFIDVEHSTELLVAEGDARGRAAVEAILAVARERIEPYGGREVKALGDGLMLVFPAPRQAVSFAVAVQRALLGRMPRLRIGVNTGEVSGSTEDPVGEAVNAAARIASKAVGGEVLISEVVRQLVGTTPGVRFADRGRSRLKGFPDRWRLFAAAGSETAPDPAAVFGRAVELAAVDWLFEGTTRSTGRSLVLEGEAGIGKTHLAETARFRAVGAGMRVLTGGADELEQDRPGRILVALAKGLGFSLATLLDDRDHAGGSRGFAVIEAVADAIEDAAAEAPVLVVAEDLQWADDLSLRGLASLARRLGPLPVGLIVTMRPSPQPPLIARVLTALGETSTRHLRIDGLDAAAVTSLVAALTGAAPGATLTSRISGAAGNPLYVIELLRALDEGGGLRVHGGVAEVDDRALPATLRHTVIRRLTSLPPESVETLRLASLLGREFALTDLATIAGRRVVDVAAQLQAPVEAAVLSGEGDTLSFRHDLIREAVYDDIAPAIRRDLHAAAGRALAAVDAPILQVARQYALGARRGDLDAVEWLERAALECLALDPTSAVALLEQAVALAPDGWGGLARIQAALLEPLAWCGRVDEARALADALLDQRISATDEFAARRGLAVVSASAGDVGRAVGEAEAAAAVAGAPLGEAGVLACLAASMSLLTGRPPAEVGALAESALARAVEGSDDDLACAAHQSLALVAGAGGRYSEALDQARSARRLLDAGGIPPRGFLIPGSWEAAFHAQGDCFAESMAAFSVARRRAERRGELSLLVQIHAGVGMVHYFAGQWDDATSEIEAGLAVAQETGANAHHVLYQGLLALIALGRGDLLAAETALDEGQRALAAGLHLFGVDLLLQAQAGLLEVRGDASGALAVLAAVWHQTATLRGLLQYRMTGPDLIRLARTRGDMDQARSVAVDMEDLAEGSAVPSSTAAALRGRGLAEDDADLLLEAVSHYRNSPRRIELAAACEEAAAALFGHDRNREVTELLEEAAAIHLDTGADRHLARIDALLRAHGVRRRRRGPARAAHGWESLSPTESKVVGLVAKGLSNPQIGKQLYISRRTVETHLSHVFRKLDVTSRAQVAATATAATATATQGQTASPPT